MSKTVLPSTFLSIELEILPYPETWVPFLVTMSTAIDTSLIEVKKRYSKDTQLYFYQ
jgi:hypothetical protein